MGATTPSVDHFNFLKKPVREAQLEACIRSCSDVPKIKTRTPSSSDVLKLPVHHNRSILIAEDSLMNQKVIRRILASKGYTAFDFV